MNTCRTELISMTIAAGLACLLCAGYAQALPKQSLVPGGLAFIKLDNFSPDTKVYFEGKRVAVFQHDDEWLAMAGIPLRQKPGKAEFAIEYGDGLRLKTSVTVKAKKYKEQHLTITNKRKVNPYKQDMTRITAESKRKKAAKRVWTDRAPAIDFIWPTEGRISSIFGLRRFFNEQARKPHTGLDIAAPEGTPVLAAADGKVIESGNFFFSGNMIYVDHGQGIISLYAHLHSISVKPGDVVKQGQLIGTVGETGRVTGPHLHFTVIANQTLIDPLFMLPEKHSDTADEKQP